MANPTDGTCPKISVVIPALDEARRLPGTLQSLVGAENVEVIVADGGSRDSTADIASKGGASLCRSPPGKARQMNAGARLAKGEFLLFLHADTALPVDFDKEVRRILDRSGIAAGAFRLGIDGSGFLFRAVEHVANWRSRHLQMPYGDQTLFLKAETFWQVGGFPEQPLMEDFELVKRLRRRGRIALAEGAVRTSARRWRRLGVIRTTLINQVIILGYSLGVSPERLARWYAYRKGLSPEEGSGPRQTADPPRGAGGRRRSPSPRIVDGKKPRISQ